MTTRQAIEERIRFESKLRELGVEHAVETANRLRRLARKIMRHNERDCSDEWYGTPGRDGKTPSEKMDETLERAIQRLAKSTGLKLSAQGDPRGFSLLVMTEHGRDQDALGASCIGVPEE